MRGGFCECGCGQKTTIAKRTIPRTGAVEGEPHRFVHGHNRWPAVFGEGPNPTGLCQCGCGAEVPLATYSSVPRGLVKGKPVRYLRGHWRRPAPPVERPSGCWEWQGIPHDGRAGAVRENGTSVLSYRLYYERHVGAIPDEHELHHTCENPMCVNPAHLEPLLKPDHRRLHGRLNAEARSGQATAA